MATKRLVSLSQRRQRVNTANPPPDQALSRPWRDAEVRGTRTGSCCHGETVAPIQRQFQFRNLSDDPRLNLRLAGILIPTRGTD